MNYLWFKRINNNIHLCIESQLYECTLHEINAIEIIVTILRANYEISYIKNKKSKLCNNTIEIINKKSYGLKICLVNHVIILNLFGELSLTYSFDSFQWQCEIIYSFLNQNYGNKSIDYKIFSPTYLEHMLGVDIPRIERVEYATKKIMTLALYEHKKIEAPTKVRVYDHSLYKKLKQGYVDNGHMITNHICESNAERINNILKELFTLTFVILILDFAFIYVQLHLFH